MKKFSVMFFILSLFVWLNSATTADRASATLSYHGDVAYYWHLPDSYGNEEFGVRFTPTSCCTLQSANFMFYRTVGSPTSITVHIYDTLNNMPNTELGNLQVNVADLSFYPNWTTIDLTSLNLSFSAGQDFFITYTVDSGAYNTTEVQALSDDGSTGNNRAIERYGTTWGYMADNWGEDYEFLIEATITDINCDFYSDFEANITSGYIPLTVNFTDLSSENIISWQWDFNNDGVIDSYEQNPSYTYYNQGQYTVSLTVSNGDSTTTETKTNYITANINPNPVFYVNPDSLYFGYTLLNGSKTLPVTVTNYGQADLEVSNIVSSTSRYSISLPTKDISFTLSSLQSQEVDITFLPDEMGEISGNILFFTNDVSMYSLPVSGIGSTPQISSPDSTGIDFGLVYLTAQSADSTIVIQNLGNVELTINSLSFTENSNAFFYNYNTPKTIAVGGSDTIYVYFYPPNTGSFTDSLLVSNNSSNAPEYKVGLSGTCTYAPPKVPDNVTVTIEYPNATITWDAVTENIYNSPITPDGYIISYSENPGANDDNYFFLGYTDSLTYTHQNVARFSSQMFYKVIAFVDYSKGNTKYLVQLSKSSGKIKMSEVLKHLKR